MDGRITRADVSNIGLEMLNVDGLLWKGPCVSLVSTGSEKHSHQSGQWLCKASHRPQSIVFQNRMGLHACAKHFRRDLGQRIAV